MRELPDFTEIRDVVKNEVIDATNAYTLLTQLAFPLRKSYSRLALDRWERSQLALGRDLVARGRDAGKPGCQRRTAWIRCRRRLVVGHLAYRPEAGSRGRYVRVRDRPHGKWVNGPGSKRSRVLGHWGRSDGAADRLPDSEDRGNAGLLLDLPAG